MRFFWIIFTYYAALPVPEVLEGRQVPPLLNVALKL